jgi:hypothetical protein
MDIDNGAVSSNPQVLSPGNAIGQLQNHLVTYSKDLADTLYFIRRLPDSDELQVAALADKLRKDALSLHAMIDAIPDYEVLTTEYAAFKVYFSRWHHRHLPFGLQRRRETH